MPREYSEFEIVLGLKEWHTGPKSVLGAAITEMNATFLWVYFHIGIVRASDDFETPVVPIALGHVVLVTLLTFAFAAPSGAHFNPNITLATVLIGHTTVFRYVAYFIAQILGGMLGAACMRFTVGWDEATAKDLARCDNGAMSNARSLLTNAVLFHLLLCVIGGVAFDPKQREMFGPIIAPLAIATSIGIIMFSISNVFRGFGPMLNFAECVGISTVSGTWNGSEWISLAGPSLASIFHAVLYMSVPPTHTEHGRYQVPLFAHLKRD